MRKSTYDAGPATTDKHAHSRILKRVSAMRRVDSQRSSVLKEDNDDPDETMRVHKLI